MCKGELQLPPECLEAGPGSFSRWHFQGDNVRCGKPQAGDALPNR